MQLLLAETVQPRTIDRQSGLKASHTADYARCPERDQSSSQHPLGTGGSGLINV